MNWQPIETAPKDGGIFLGYNPDSGLPEAALWFEGGYGVDGYFDYAKEVLSGYAGLNLTHWMPLPTPPENTK